MGPKWCGQTAVCCRASAVLSSRTSLSVGIIAVIFVLPSFFLWGQLVAAAQVPTGGGSP